MANKGFLLVTMQPPPAFEEEFNAWYDSEHLPERLAVPGVETALRFVATDGHPKYLAMYDLENQAVMASEAYLRVAFDKSSPWTKRVTARVRPWRSAGDQIWPGTAVTRGGARLLLLRFRGLAATAGPAIIEAARRSFEGRPETLQMRVLAFDTGKTGTDFMVFVELKAPLATVPDLAAFGAHAERIDLVNSYAPY